MGNKGYLYVQVSEGGYDYQLYHSDFSEWDGGQVDTDGTMNEAKRMILEMYEMDTQTHERILTDELKWDVDKKKVYVSLDWGNADEINIVCGKYEIEKIGHERQS